MDTKSCMVVLLRVVAVLSLSEAFGVWTQVVAYLMQSSNVAHNPLPLEYAMFIMPFLCGLAVWILAPQIAALATRKLPDSIRIGNITIHEFTQAMLLTVGAWIFVNALPSLVALLVSMWNARQQMPEMFELAFEINLQVPQLAARILDCVLGLVLIIGSRRTSKSLLKLRYVGTK